MQNLIVGFICQHKRLRITIDFTRRKADLELDALFCNRGFLDHQSHRNRCVLIGVDIKDTGPPVQQCFLRI